MEVKGQRRLVEVKQFILANLHDTELDVERIASTHNMAPRTLYRMFSSEGTTPIRWLWQQRLAASFKALAEGQATQVTETAMRFGFSDLSHFSRAFKAEFELTPRELKRRVNH